MITEVKIKGLNNLKKCSLCFKEVKTIYTEYTDTENNIFMKREKGICKLCLNKLIKEVISLKENNAYRQNIK